MQNKAAKAATKWNAREAEEERYNAAEAATGISANGKHAQKLQARGPAMTWTCTDKMQDKAAKAAKRRSAHEVEEEQHRAARAAAGMSAHDNHAQKLYVHNRSRRGGRRGSIRTASNPDVAAGTASTSDEAAKAAQGGKAPAES